MVNSLRPLRQLLSTNVASFLHFSCPIWRAMHGHTWLENWINPTSNAVQV